MEKELNERTYLRPMAKPTKEADRRVVYNGYPLYLPDEETLERFKEAYPDTPNAWLTELTHRSEGYNSRLGNYLGLKKSPEFLERRQRHAAAKAGMNHTKGKPPKGVYPEQLKPYGYDNPNGNTPLSGNDLSARMTELWRKEKLRAKYGLQRQSKLNIKL
ncbi:MAG: hypothetical protein IKP37_02545 [Paludibacteraceae bacterium]|nr:hypothetical protein [Paludibacteraceae bacterium]